MENIQKSSKVLHVLLWIFQIILGGMFIMAGYMKVTVPLDQLIQQMAWVEAVGTPTRLIGAAEMLGAIGLILPSALRIRTILTPLAATGLVLVMLLAMIFHISRGEFSVIGINIFLGLSAAFVAWGRFRKVPIQGK